MQNIISILHAFSCKLYGLKKYKGLIKEAKEIAKELQDENKPDTWTGENVSCKNRRCAIIKCERRCIKIQTLAWVGLKEKWYIPVNPNTHMIKIGTVSQKAGKYYVSVLVYETESKMPVLNGSGIGIDLGVKEFAVLSNGAIKKNINQTQRIKKLEKQLKRQQRCLSRKYKD